MQSSGTVFNSARDILSVVFRRKALIVITFLVVTIIAFATTWLRPEVYSAEAKLLIRLGRENLQVDPSVSGPTVNPMGSRENEINSELAILQSRDLAEKLVDTVGESAFVSREGAETPEGGAAAAVRTTLRTAKHEVGDFLRTINILPTLSDRDKAVDRAMRRLSVRVEKRSNIISASFEAGSPEMAQKALEQLVVFYLDRHIEVYSAQASPGLFETQAEAHQEDLARCEQELEAFRNLYGIADMQRQKESMLERLTVTKSEVGDAAAQLSQVHARIASLQKSLAGRPSRHELSRTTGRTNYAADAMKERLAELRLQETDMAGRYPATHRPLMHLRQQIEQLEGTLAGEEETLTEVTTGIDVNREQLLLSLANERAQESAMKARQEVLAAELKRQEDALVELSSRELELARLERNVELAEKDYRQYRENLQRARISYAMDLGKVSNVSVVQAPVAWPYPVRPKRLRDCLLGMAAGAFLGLFLAFAREYLDDSLSAKEHVEKRLNIPVLAVIKDKVFKAYP